MSKIITLGALTIPTNTVYKSSLILLLTTIVGLLVYIIYWIST